MWSCYRVSFSEELICASWMTSQKCWLLARYDIYVHFEQISWLKMGDEMLTTEEKGKSNQLNLSSSSSRSQIIAHIQRFENSFVFTKMKTWDSPVQPEPRSCWPLGRLCVSLLAKRHLGSPKKKKPFNYLVRRSSWSIRNSVIRIFKSTVWHDDVIPERLLLILILLKWCKMQTRYHIASCSSSCCRWWKQFQGHM